MDSTALFKLSYGVYVVSTWEDGRKVGCVANSAMQVTAVPETVAVSIHHDNYTNHCIAENGHFSLTVMPENTPPLTIGKFGFFSSSDTDKFAEIPHEIKQYMPVLSEGCAYVVCDVIDRFETPTHTIFLGQVTDAGHLSKEPPMSYDYYHKVVKGKAPKNAPTFQAES